MCIRDRVGINLDALAHLAQSEIVLPRVMLGYAQIEVDTGGEWFDFAGLLDGSNGINVFADGRKIERLPEECGDEAGFQRKGSLELLSLIHI